MTQIYQPKSRRPIADSFRRTARSTVELCCRHSIHPDAISYFSMVAAAFAAVCFFYSGRWPWLLLIAPLGMYLRLWLNMLDGMVALASGKASWRGEILNDLPDRASDVLIFAGVAHSGLCNQALGYWGAIAALLTAYVGTFGQAVGVQREFSGIMAKPWRMVMLHLGAWATWAMLHFAGTAAVVQGGSYLDNDSVKRADLTVLDITLQLILLGCIQTIFIRLKRIFAALKVKQSQEDFL